MVPSHVRDAFEASYRYLPTPLRRFQFLDKYSRYDTTLGRRETWIETVDRTVGFLMEAAPAIPGHVFARLRTAILNQDVMPSMRLFASAGPNARRNNISIYNCSYLPVDSLEAFSEALLISMNGCGVGFSVEQKYVKQLPALRLSTYQVVPVFVPDTTEGWQEALLQSLRVMVDGYDVVLDVSAVRPAGSPLKTKGGVASGPEPLVDVVGKINRIIKDRRFSGFLRPIDAYDIMCLVGNAAVSGGHRRTAMIALFDASDADMLNAKPDGFWNTHPWRANANNSAVWETEPSQAQYLAQMAQLFEHGTGEPGIFSRYVAVATMPERRSRDWASDMGTNPCGEIVLRPWQFCNLSAVVARPHDTEATLTEKVELATIIGTIQSSLTHFPGLRSIWKANCEEERLLGVDITGQMDCLAVRDNGVLARLRRVAVETNKRYADLMGINQSAAVTCVKPSGNTSQLVDCSSGLHARWAPYYVRNVRLSAHSPLYEVLKAANYPLTPEVGQDAESATTWVVGFPVKAPYGAITRHNLSALDQCYYWLTNKVYWTEHNPSVTITYKPEEVLDLTQWVWDHRDFVGGMAFLPSFDTPLPLLPYQEISQEEYEELMASLPDEVDWASIVEWEHSDQSNAASTLACESDLCLLTAGA